MMSINGIKSKFFWVPSIFTVIDVILKFFHISLWGDLSRLGLQDQILWMGIIELCCLVFFLLSRTLGIGFFLLSCFWGVVIVTSLYSQSFNLFAILMLTLFAIAAYWRDSSDIVTDH